MKKPRKVLHGSPQATLTPAQQVLCPGVSPWSHRLCRRFLSIKRRAIRVTGLQNKVPKNNMINIQEPVVLNQVVRGGPPRSWTSVLSLPALPLSPPARFSCWQASSEPGCVLPWFSLEPKNHVSAFLQHQLPSQLIYHMWEILLPSICIFAICIGLGLHLANLEVQGVK